MEESGRSAQLRSCHFSYADLPSSITSRVLSASENPNPRKSTPSSRDIPGLQEDYGLLAQQLLFVGSEAAWGGGGGGRHRGGAEAPSQAAPSASRGGEGSCRGLMSPSLLPSPLCGAGRGGSMLRRNLSACGGVVSQLHWLPCNDKPPRSTGTVSPATPGDNQDVGSCSSWDNLRKYWKSAKYSKINLLANYSRSAAENYT